MIITSPSRPTFTQLKDDFQGTQIKQNPETAHTIQNLEARKI